MCSVIGILSIISIYPNVACNPHGIMELNVGCELFGSPRNFWIHSNPKLIQMDCVVNLWYFWQLHFSGEKRSHMKKKWSWRCSSLDRLTFKKQIRGLSLMMMTELIPREIGLKPGMDFWGWQGKMIFLETSCTQTDLYWERKKKSMMSSPVHSLYHLILEEANIAREWRVGRKQSRVKGKGDDSIKYFKTHEGEVIKWLWERNVLNAPS